MYLHTSKAGLLGELNDSWFGRKVFEIEGILVFSDRVQFCTLLLRQIFNQRVVTNGAHQVVVQIE